jgi:hypothetical protein
VKKLVVLRSVTGQARKYADRNFKHFVWFDDIISALSSLADMVDRPWFVVVDGGRGVNLGLGSRATTMGYVVETKGVP